MVAILTPAERAEFKACRRLWDFHSAGRRNLEPVAPNLPLDADRMLRDALAVYYFPGMWDWPRAVVLPLVTKALDKAVAREREHFETQLPADFDTRTTAVTQLLGAYLEWAPTVERIAPVLVEADFEVDLRDPAEPESALIVETGDHVRYQGRVDLLAMDEHDAYWVLRHRVVDAWTSTEGLLRDEEAVTACWAWEQFYIGMEIAGTIHNELCLPAGLSGAALPAGVAWAAGAAGAEPAGGGCPAPPPASGRERGGVPQHEGSGGGRSIPQHRRLYAQASEPGAPDRLVQEEGPLFRRTWIRRSRAEVEQAGRQLVAEAREILAGDNAVFPAPSEGTCRRCVFGPPCLALYGGGDGEEMLGSDYRPRTPAEPVEGRLGGVSWSTGRGAAPARFSAGGGSPG